MTLSGGSAEHTGFQKMNIRRLLVLAVAGSVYLGGAGDGHAQSVDAEIDANRAKIEAQREELRQRREAQARRGLKIQTGSDSASEAASGSSSAGATTSGTGGATAAAEPAYQVYDSGNEIAYPIQFAYDSDDLTASARETLESAVCPALSQDIAENADARYLVVGHTDAAGSAAYNKGLSQRRAAAARDHMIGACDIAARRLKAVGMGEAYLDEDHGPRDAAQRRVEFQVAE